MRQTQGWLLGLTDRYRAFNVGTVETLGTIGNLLGPVVANARQVIRLNQLKDDFVAAAAQDLKTLVAAIKDDLQLALRLAHSADWEQLTPSLKLIDAQTNQLARHVDTLLDRSQNWHH